VARFSKRLYRQLKSLVFAPTLAVAAALTLSACGVLNIDSLGSSSSKVGSIVLSVSGTTSIAVNEGSTLAVIYNLSQPREVATVVNVTLTSPRNDVAAVFGAPPIHVTIPAGQTAATVVLNSVYDPLYTGDRDFSLSVSVADDVVRVSGANLSVYVKDLESVPALKLSSATQSITEGASASAVVTLTPASATAVTVDYATSDGTALAPADYTQANGTLTFAPGETSKTISLATVDDAAIESAETFSVALTNLTGTATLGTATQTVTIVDNDFANLTIADMSVTEGSNLVFTVTLSPASTGTVTVDYASVDGTGANGALAGTDYTSVTGTLTFAAGETSKTVSVPTTAKPSEVCRADRTMTVELSNEANATLGDSVGIGTIVDPDLPVLSIASVGAVTEGAASQFTASLSQACATHPVGFTWETTNGTAMETADYTAVVAQAGAIAAGSTSTTLSVATIDDAIYEGAETFSVNLSSPSYATLGTSSATASITDNEVQPTVQFAVAVSSGAENVTPASITVSLSGASASTITVDYAVSGGSATAGADFTLANATLTFAPGDTSKTISMPVIDDSIYEGSETVEITLSNATNATLGAITMHTRTILEDDSAPIASVSDTSVNENAGTVSIDVALDTASSLSTTVTYSTLDGTATSPADYTGVITGSVVIPAGSQHGTIHIAIANDTMDEDDETFDVVLNSAVNASVSMTQDIAHVTVLDDDAPPTITVGDPLSATEGDGTLAIPVTLSAKSGKVISFTYTTADGTAMAPGDYTATSGAASIPAGSTSTTLTIPIVDDSVLCEVPETFTATISSLTNATAGTSLVSHVTLYDNDLPDLTITPASVNEGSIAVFHASLSFACPDAITMNYFTLPGTATEGLDYTRATGSRTFNAGATTTPDIVVSTINDSLTEVSQETFFLGLTGADNVTIGSSGIGAGTIIDDDGLGLATVKIAASYWNTCALNSAGEAKCWGENYYLGNDGLNLGDEPGEMGDALPALDLGTVDFLGVTPHTATQVMRESQTTCVRLEGGQVKCWGANYVGEAGAGSYTDYNLTNIGDEDSEFGDGVKDIDFGTVGALGATKLTTKQMATAGSTKCFILSDDGVKCFGEGQYSLLGRNATRIGTSDAHMGDNLPYVDLGTHDALGITKHSVKQLAGEAQAFCAILDDDRVKCWGNNSSGQLGQGDTLTRGSDPLMMGDGLPYVDLGTNRTAKKIVGGAGGTFCAILDDNGLKCWGNNSQGQLGLGNTQNRGDQPNEMGDDLPYVDLGTHDGLGVTPHTAKDISLGDSFSCAILDDGRVKCWGYGYRGALGNGSTLTRGNAANQMGDNLPYALLGTGHTAKSLRAKSRNVFVIRDDDSLVAWGANSYGELGQGHTTDLQSAAQLGNNLVPIDVGTGLHAVSISDGSGLNSACAVLSNGQAKCWGASNPWYGFGIYLPSFYIGGYPNQMGTNLPKISLPAGTHLVDLQISSGTVFAVYWDAFGLTSDGHLVYWGNTQSAAGDTVDSMGATTPTYLAAGGLKYRTISVGMRLACGIDEHFDLRCWGAHIADEQSAWAFFSPSNAPIVSLGRGRKVMSVSVANTANSSMVCAILDNAKVKCFGSNNFGQLGLGDTVSRGTNPGDMGDNLPYVDLGSVGTPIQIVSGSANSCALFDNGKVKCWGQGSAINGQGHTSRIGSLPGQMGDALSFIDLGTGHTAKWIQAANSHACALRDDDTFICWGDNDYTELGRDNTGNNRAIGDSAGEMGDALTTVDLNGAIVASAALGARHTCALTTVGDVKCWGLNIYGQLGLGDRVNRGAPSTMGSSLPSVDLGW
jgi:alpha-tubulin suppressor-like RCC1 family protein